MHVFTIYPILCKCLHILYWINKSLNSVLFKYEQWIISFSLEGINTQFIYDKLSIFQKLRLSTLMIPMSKLFKRNYQVMSSQGKTHKSCTVQKNCFSVMYMYLFLYIIGVWWSLICIKGTMIVQKLKALIQRLYKLDSEIKLSYISKKVSFRLFVQNGEITSSKSKNIFRKIMHTVVVHVPEYLVYIIICTCMYVLINTFFWCLI